MAHACHKLVQINKVWMLNLGLRKVKQETTAPQITLFYQTHTMSHTKGFEITATPQVGILFTPSLLKKQKNKFKF